MNEYDGVLQRPFLAEHWYKGLVAAMAAWLPLFFLAAWVVPDYTPAACIGFASVVSVAILAAALTQYEGFELQPQLARYRTYTWVLGLRFGEWQPFPPVDHVTVRAYNRRHFLPLDGGVRGFTAADFKGQGPGGDPPLRQRPRFGFVATDFEWQVLLGLLVHQSALWPPMPPKRKPRLLQPIWAIY